MAADDASLAEPRTFHELWTPVGAEGSARAARTRNFLIISAPFGPFARELAWELRQQRATVTRVILNGGDLLDWGVRDARPYFGGLNNWLAWLERAIGEGEITDIITYGDSSPYAAKALRHARAMGVQSHVLEQGYFRPDWITLERGGVNANSNLPRDPDWFRTHPSARTSQALESVGKTMPRAVVQIVGYHCAMYLGAVVFTRFRTNYGEPAIRQALSHMLRFGLQRVSRRRYGRVFEAATGAGPAFLCVLQRPGDSQLWRHSDYASIPAFVECVVASFAAYAPAGSHLIVRPHPLDPGLVPHAAVVAAAAARHGVAGRVSLVDHGKLHEVLPKVAGVVCVNSTAGLAAVEFGRPTITLGRAIYDMPGMTHQGCLDEFWRTPQFPDPSLYEAFRKVVIAETQINGAYATPRGRRLAVQEAARRLMSGCESDTAQRVSNKGASMAAK